MSDDLDRVTVWVGRVARVVIAAVVGFAGAAFVAGLVVGLVDGIGSFQVPSRISTPLYGWVAVVGALVSALVSWFRDVWRDRDRAELREDLVRAEADPDAPGLSAEVVELSRFQRTLPAAESIVRGLPALSPRSAKRLVSHLWVMLDIAEQRGVFGGSPELTTQHLGKWGLILEQWSRLGGVLVNDPARVAELESAATVEQLQDRLDALGPGLLGSPALLDALRRDPPLAPVLGRLVHYRPAEGAEGLGSDRDGDAGAPPAAGP